MSSDKAKDPLDLSEESPLEEIPEDVSQLPSLYAFHTVHSETSRFDFRRWVPRPFHLGALLLLVALVLFWRHAGGGLDVDERDRRLLPTAAHFAMASRAFRPVPSSERFVKEREWGGRLKLKYTYEHAGHPEIRILCWVDESEEEARETFRETNAHTLFDWRLVGRDPVGLIWLDEGRPWADESRVYLVERGGVPVGHSLALRVGNKTVYARVEGVVLDGTRLHQLFYRSLRDLRGYRAA